MKKRLLTCSTAKVAGTLLIITSIAAANSVTTRSSGGDFDLTRSTIASGGGESSDGRMTLVATIAQPVAQKQQSSGGEFALAGGFWASATEVLFSNGFEGN